MTARSAPTRRSSWRARNAEPAPRALARSLQIFGRPRAARAAVQRAGSARSPMTLTSVPVIDIAPYRAGGADGKARVARAVAEACRDIGFLIVTGHGVAPALIDRVDRAS